MLNEGFLGFAALLILQGDEPVRHLVFVDVADVVDGFLADAGSGDEPRVLVLGGILIQPTCKTVNRLL